MKKIQSMMLMLLVAVMGICVQSCGDDDNNSSPVLSMYTIQAKLVDKGNLGADAVAQINQLCDAIKRTGTATEDAVIKALDTTMPSFAASFPTKGENDVNAIYTIKIYITNSAGKEIYSRRIEIKDGEAKY